MENSFYHDSDSFGKLSKINSAGLVNSTLSNLWTDFFRHFRDGKYLSANNDLDCIWTILGGEKNDDLNKEHEKLFMVLEEKLSTSGILEDSLQVRGFAKVSDEQIKKFLKHKGLLLQKSLFLRRLQNKQGKGTAYNDGDDEDFE